MRAGSSVAGRMVQELKVTAVDFRSKVMCQRLKIIL